MPGGRLTLHERECIETGLADGLGYADIARRLDRPSSTISREVTRNGGPGRYRADRAHRATAVRARRSGGPPAQQTPAAGPAEDNEALRDFATQFTELFVYDGMPRMQARVMTCLHLTDSGSLTAAELVHRLGVSPASISTAVGALEKRDLLRRERDSRRDRYYIDGDTWYRTTLQLARAAEERVRVARRGAEILGVTTPSGIRLQEIADYLDYLGREMVMVVERRHRSGSR
ncbi:helix-turn-helix domain-containing protein [Nocardia sp. NPDC051750]|uniref:helix-turn-helix domain-containing protein n=1 Tax=Nocardia sp. NPDC051750 TaxID=3364325 RepID=UPI0037A1BA5F